MRFYNFRKCEFEDVYEDNCDERSDYSDYVGPLAIHENLYNLYVLDSNSPLAAAIKVLERQIDAEG